MIVLFSSCGKETNNEYSYTSKTIVNNMPPLMGSCIESTGSLLVFSLPMLADNFQSAIMSAKIHKITDNGNDNIIFDFKDQTFSYYGWSKDTFSNIYAWVPDNVKVNLVQNSQNRIFFSCNNGSSVYWIDNNDQITIQYIDKVVSMTSNRQDGVYIITSPIFSGSSTSYTLSSPPEIYEINKMNSRSLYFIFPQNITFNSNCGYEGYPSAMYPIDIHIDMAVDKENNIFVSFGYDNKIFEIDNNKILSTYLDNIFCPVSIAIDNSNRILVVSAPKFIKDSNELFKMIKPVEVYLIKSKTASELIYKGSIASKEFGGCHYYDSNDDCYMLSNTDYDISVNSKNEIYLVSTDEGKIILIK